MSTEIQAFLIALAIATIPNLIIKWIESRKPKEELGKSTIEAADLSLDMLIETINSQRESIKFLQERTDFKKREVERLSKENEDLCLKIEELEKEIKILTENKGE